MDATSTELNGPFSWATRDAGQSVYQSYRWGDFSYVIPNPTPGTAYTVRLDFCENIATAVGDPVFNVAINGAPVLTNFDIFAAAGGAFKALTRQFNATADSSGPPHKAGFRTLCAQNPLRTL